MKLLSIVIAAIRFVRFSHVVKLADVTAMQIGANVWLILFPSFQYALCAFGRLLAVLWMEEFIAGLYDILSFNWKRAKNPNWEILFWKMFRPRGCVLNDKNQCNFMLAWGLRIKLGYAMTKCVYVHKLPAWHTKKRMRCLLQLLATCIEHKSTHTPSFMHTHRNSNNEQTHSKQQ